MRKFLFVLAISFLGCGEKDDTTTPCCEYCNSYTEFTCGGMCRLLELFPAKNCEVVGGCACYDPLSQPPQPNSPTVPNNPSSSNNPPSSNSDSCCRHCSSGKPCGDSCISRDKTCSKPSGCACY